MLSLGETFFIVEAKASAVPIYCGVVKDGGYTAPMEAASLKLFLRFLFEPCLRGELRFFYKIDLGGRSIDSWLPLTDSAMRISLAGSGDLLPLS